MTVTMPVVGGFLGGFPAIAVSVASD